MNFVEHLEHVIGLIDSGKPLAEIKAAILAIYEEASGYDQARLNDAQRDPGPAVKKVDPAQTETMSTAGDFVENMGVLWRRRPTGYEPYPYCKECSSHPIMTPNHEIGIWGCGNGKHHAPISVKPPRA